MDERRRHNEDVSPQSQAALALVIALVAIAAAAAAFGRSPLGRRIGRRATRATGNVVVRCRSGHLFTTTWVPGMSFKAIRLGFTRFQYCPVGEHWTLVSPVDTSRLTEAERRTADAYRDTRIP